MLLNNYLIIRGTFVLNSNHTLNANQIILTENILNSLNKKIHTYDALTVHRNILVYSACVCVSALSGSWVECCLILIFLIIFMTSPQSRPYIRFITPQKCNPTLHNGHETDVNLRRDSNLAKKKNAALKQGFELSVNICFCLNVFFKRNSSP